MSQRGRSNKEDRGRKSSPSPDRSIRSSRTSIIDKELSPNDSISMVSSNRGIRSHASNSLKSTRRSEPRREQSLLKQAVNRRIGWIDEDEQDQRVISRRSGRSELRNKDSESSCSKDSRRSGKDAESLHSRDSHRSGKDRASSHSRDSRRSERDGASSYSRDSHRSGTDSLRSSRAKTEHTSHFNDSDSKAIVRHKSNDRGYDDRRSDASRSTVRTVRRDRDIDDTKSLISRASLSAKEQALILRNRQSSAYDDDYRSQSSRSIASHRGRDRSSSTVVTGSSRMDVGAHSSALLDFDREAFEPGDEVQVRTKTRTERTKDGKQVVHKQEDVTIRLGDGSDSGRRSTTALSNTYNGALVENRAPRGIGFHDDRATSGRIDHQSSHSSHHHTSSSETHTHCCHGGGTSSHCCHGDMDLVVTWEPVPMCHGHRRNSSW
jgi:hypothetical protein